MGYASLVERIAGRRSAAWDVHRVASQRQAAGDDVIFFSIGDPDFSTPDPITDRAVEALRAGDTHYAAVEGRESLRSAIAERFSTTGGIAVSAASVVVLAGTQNALFAASLCLLDRGDEVITLDPMYVTYEATLQVGGASLVTAPTGPGFRIETDAIAARINDRTRAIAITSPANPTGVVATRAELERLAELAIANDLWVIADEVYADLVYDGEHISIASLDGMADRTVTVSSLSKSHAMTGWRCGWLIAPPELAEHVARLAMAMVYGLPGFVQEAAIVALDRSDTVVAEMRSTYRRRRDLACSVLAEAADLPVLSPAAGMYVMIDVRASGLSSNEFSWRLLEDKAVSALDAGVFGATAEGWLRLAFTTGDAELEEGCRRIVELWREIGPAPRPGR